MSLVLIAALVLPGQHPGGPVPADVAKVVLEKMIADSSPELVLCINANGSEPPLVLLKQLQRSDRTVVASSECQEATDVNHPSYHVKTQRPAHFLSVSDAIWTSKTALTVQANEFYHGKWAKFWTVKLARDGSRWRIVSFHEDAEA